MSSRFCPRWPWKNERRGFRELTPPIFVGDEDVTGDLPQKDYESLNYDQCPNVPYRNMMANLSENTFFYQHLMRWVMVGIIGCCTGVIAFFIDFVVRHLDVWKFEKVRSFFCPDGVSCLTGNSPVTSTHLVLGVVVLVGINCLFALIAGILTLLEPVAAGSGIPEIKCYLNGVKVPRVARLRTLISKAIGVLFSVAGGFFVGKEGPMIHSGAIVGAGVPQFQSIAFRRINFDFPYFRSDRDKRDFVSSGAAAGVAAAFGAPIGGVLFSLEEGSSFWNQGLTWRTLFCSMASTFTLNVLLTAVSYAGWYSLDNPSLIDFGVFECSKSSNECNLWTFIDLVIFIAMGAVGGLLGAAFNTINTALSRYRMSHLQRRGRVVRLVEVVLIAMVTSVATYGAMISLGSCQLMTHHLDTRQDTTLQNMTRLFFCPVDHFNDMATVFFNSQEDAIKQFFHQRAPFSVPTLLCYVTIFFIIACWTYGAGVPSGLFVPSLACGAAYGRLVAEVLMRAGYLSPENSQVGTFSLVGAAAFLGGVVRMTISLTVILIESTNNISFGFPIMVTLMVAKWTGDLFNTGLYDIHIHLRGIPLLEWDAPDHIHSLTASDIMSKKLHYLFPRTRVKSVCRLLRTTMHHAYPVVTMHCRVQPEPIEEDLSDGATSAEMSRSSSPCPDSLQISSRHVNGEPIFLSTGNSNLKGRNPAYQAVHRAHLLQETPDTLLPSQIHVDMSRSASPVASSSSSGSQQSSDRVLLFHGVILRHHLVKLLEQRCYVDEGESADELNILDHMRLIEDYPRYHDIFDIAVPQSDMNMILDVTAYMNPCPYTVSPLSPVPYVFNLFRTMGLRHLMVVDYMGQVIGVITRHNLTHNSLSAVLRRTQEMGSS